jgi:putative transcriptional regulator
MTKTYRSPISAAVHEAVRDMYEIGLADDKTMRHFDESCLTPLKPLSPKQIRAIRVNEGTSQTVFASYLNVTPGLVSQWERGEKKPSGPSLKLLTLARNKGLQAIA